MFTVKWIVKHKAGEVIRMFEAREVTAAYRDASHKLPDNKPWMVAGRQVDVGKIILDAGDIAGTSLAHGKVYVMNEAGATVGSYHLSDEVMDYADAPVAQGEQRAA